MIRFLVFGILLALSANLLAEKETQAKSLKNKKSSSKKASKKQNSESKTSQTRFTIEEIREINRSWIQNELDYTLDSEQVSNTQEIAKEPEIKKVEKVEPEPPKKFVEEKEKPNGFFQKVVAFVLANKNAFAIGAIIIIFALYSIQKGGKSNLSESSRVRSRFRNK
ncbi:MAG: hypothetical protein SFU98_15415 [Leptospiraceae bacterium]|nr:hypothetical protein [Leptospiraceae bacterium]